MIPVPVEAAGNIKNAVGKTENIQRYSSDRRRNQNERKESTVKRLILFLFIGNLLEKL